MYENYTSCPCLLLIASIFMKMPLFYFSFPKLFPYAIGCTHLNLNVCNRYQHYSSCTCMHLIVPICMKMHLCNFSCTWLHLCMQKISILFQLHLYAPNCSYMHENASILFQFNFSFSELFLYVIGCTYLYLNVCNRYQHYSSCTCMHLIVNCVILIAPGWTWLHIIVPI